MFPRTLFFCLLLSLSVWAEAWHLPDFKRQPSQTPMVVLEQAPLPGNRTLVLGEMQELGKRVPVIQLNRGKRPQWRVQADFGQSLAWPTTNQKRLRYEAQTRNLAIVRCFVSRGHGEWGDVALAINLSDGARAWVADPIVASIDQPGGPNLVNRDSLYETYQSPTWAPLIVRRRLSDGKALFAYDLPRENDEDDDLVLRKVQGLKMNSDGLQVQVADKLRRWQTYLLSTQDGSLKSQRSGVAGLREKLWK